MESPLKTIKIKSSVNVNAKMDGEEIFAKMRKNVRMGLMENLA